MSEAQEAVCGVELLIEAAESHGMSSEPDHEVGDLQDVLRAAWGLMSPGQRKALLESQREFLENEYLGDAEKAIAGAMDAEDERGTDGVVGELIEKFPGLLNGNDEVNGGDLVDWMGENMGRFAALAAGG